MYTCCPILRCQIPQYWEAPLLVQIVYLRQQLSKRLSPLISPPPSFSFPELTLHGPTDLPLFVEPLLFHYCRTSAPDLLQGQTQRQGGDDFSSFSSEPDSTCSHDNESVQTLIFLLMRCTGLLRSSNTLYNVLRSWQNWLEKALIFHVRDLYVVSGPAPTTNRRHRLQHNLSSVALISFHQQTDSSQICPSRWHIERRKKARKTIKKSGDEWGWGSQALTGSSLFVMLGRGIPSAKPSLTFVGLIFF